MEIILSYPEYRSFFLLIFTQKINIDVIRNKILEYENANEMTRLFNQIEKDYIDIEIIKEKDDEIKTIEDIKNKQKTLREEYNTFNNDAVKQLFLLNLFINNNFFETNYWGKVLDDFEEDMNTDADISEQAYILSANQLAKNFKSLKCVTEDSIFKFKYGLLHIETHT